jgi:hypothetical protein
MYFHTLAALNRVNGRDDALFALVAQGRIGVAVGKAQEAFILNPAVTHLPATRPVA